MNIKCKTDKGRIRENNQDYVVTLKGKKYILLIVADGMGGHNAGEIASKSACITIRDYIFKNFDGYESIENLIKDSIVAANEEVYKKSLSNKNFNGMGTTVTCSLIYKDNIYIGHVGDSRAYLINKVGIVKITQDHSYVQELIDNGSITEKEAINHPQRNIITRAVGTEMDVTIDIKMMNINKGDYILICTDGLTNYINNDEIFEIVSSNKKNAVDELINLAKERGGSDNISIIIAGKEGENE